MKTKLFLPLFGFMVITILFSSLKAQSDSCDFLCQIRGILAASELHNFNEIKGELLDSLHTGKGVKEYACKNNLDGFVTYFKEKEGVLEFWAYSIMPGNTGSSLSRPNIMLLLDKTIRDKEMPGYTNQDYSGVVTATTEKFETVTLLINPDHDSKLMVCKRRNGAGYRLFIIR